MLIIFISICKVDVYLFYFQLTKRHDRYTRMENGGGSL